MIYSSLTAGSQWDTPEECFSEGLSQVDNFELWDAIESCESFHISKIIPLIMEHLPELYEEAIYKAMHTWVDCMEADEDDEEILSEFKTDYFVSVGD